MNRFWRLANSGRHSGSEQQPDAHDGPRNRPAIPDSGPSEVASLASLIESHERLIHELTAAVAAQQALLKSLYRSRPASFKSLGAGQAPSSDSIRDMERAVEITDFNMNLLGPFRLTFNGKQQAPWASQRACSVLKYLLIHDGHLIPREKIMEAFWPHSSPKSARNNLNASIYQLRSQLRALQPDRSHVLYSAGCYRISARMRYRTDLMDYSAMLERAFQALHVNQIATSTACFQTARSLYAGPLLEDDLSGDWCLELQRQLQIEHCAALEQLGNLLLEQDEPMEAVAVGNDLLEADPYRETGHQLLMQAYAALGQSQLVIEQYRRCDVTMRRELSLAPAQTTVDLVHRLVPGYR